VYGGGLLFAIGGACLRDRFNDVTTDLERRYNRRRNCQGYAAFTGAALAWSTLVVSWLLMR